MGATLFSVNFQPWDASNQLTAEYDSWSSACSPSRARGMGSSRRRRPREPRRNDDLCARPKGSARV